MAGAQRLGGTQSGPGTRRDGDPENANAFERYLQSEYDHIAEAHFRTIESISSFFRYYLLIVSVPISLIVIVLTVAPRPEDLRDVISSLNPLLATVFLVISIVAFAVMLYVANLRMDALLYARTVNAIRKHFYDRADSNLEDRLRTRVLPQTSSQPAYFEGLYFLFVILAFAVLDAFYMVVFFVLLLGLGETSTRVHLAFQNIPWWSWSVTLPYFLAHPACYFLLARYREHEYLRSYIIGVDIDGVLNEHRTHFCNALKRHTGRVLDPDAIKQIPLHECPDVGVTREGEELVFNDPRYWTEMIPLGGAAENLGRIRNAFKLKVWIFTSRPWPNVAAMRQNDVSQVEQQWADAALTLLEGTGDWRWPAWALRLSWLPEVIRSWLRARLMKSVTRAWLSRHRFCYEKLFVEKGSDDVSDPQGHFHNRFYLSRKHKIRFFAEDDREKASKLAHICDVVLLLDQPYNQEDATPLPGNVVRVHSWDEIYRKIRAMS
jgi:uncharacterized HAD superfamily protein